MLASALLYLGAAVAALGLLAAVRRRGRRIALLAAAGGAARALVALLLPAPEHAVAAPRTHLDAAMPRWHFHERHALRVAADPAAVDRAIRAVTADEIALYRTLTWIRRLGRRGPPSLLDAPAGMPMLDLATRTGFRVIADAPGRAVVLRVALPTHRAPVRLAHAAIDFRVDRDARGGSVVTTETRVFAPEPAARRAFARYWRVIHPGSALIRRGWLAAIRRRAEAEAAR
ncbi:hypothetical protein [Roseisolibacter sp. H3M3-2]|uniref:hypothetical protein n=1 Tax=Roseisolibacter sp. H3M3-2 TaxID=3031323 RepID=UPI0023DC5F16|nr:hypothetical protein [Roseisolibacter sp. H3M3-2]MDF1505397.1 hypothetical protein [Roseisolibacter sp. H3M3-2]